MVLVGSIGYTWTRINSSTSSPCMPLTHSDLVSSYTRLGSNFSLSGFDSSNALWMSTLSFSLIRVLEGSFRPHWCLECSWSSGDSVCALYCLRGASPSSPCCSTGLALAEAQLDLAGDGAFGLSELIRAELLGREFPKFRASGELAKLELSIILACW